jgi:hypothetical protein
MIVLVNHGEKDVVRDLVVPSSAGDITLSLQARLSGAVVIGKSKGVEAVESSADVLVNRELLIDSDLHFMAISIGEEPLKSSRAVLLLPMGEGHLGMAGADRWRQPVVQVGEMIGARWKLYESFHPEQDGNVMKLPINASRALSMLILCEAADQATAVKQVETMIDRPWTLVP